MQAASVSDVSPVPLSYLIETLQSNQEQSMSDTFASSDASQTPSSADTLPTPKGIGMAVAFDWGLTVQLLVMPLLPLLFGGSPMLGQLHLSLPVQTLLSFVIALPFAFLIFLFGEGVRRGWRWTRPVQVVINALLFLAGFGSLVNFIQQARHGSYWSLATVVILLVFSPLIAWRLSRSTTTRWFANVTSVEARRRHGGAWPYFIALCAIVGGTLQALAAFFR